MFNGIVEETGVVSGIDHKKNLSTLWVRAEKVLRGAKRGDSIAVNGACLTVTDIKKDTLAFDLMKETIAKTSLGKLRAGSRVNLERALKVGTRLSGHFVTGHVDETGGIRKRIETENYTEFQVGMSRKIAKFIAPKGSVCLDGVSLTVGDVRKNYFSVYLIPFTKNVTTLGVKRKGDVVNVEADVLARYILNSFK